MSLSILRSLFTTRPNSRRKKHHRPKDAEVLEDRALLAGNVIASLNAGNLTITGDSQDNSVFISLVSSENGGDDILRVTSFDTAVNGSAADFTVPLDSLGSLTIDMKGGDDDVGVVARINGNLTAKMGGGRDTLTTGDILGGVPLTATPIIGNATIDMGSAPFDPDLSTLAQREAASVFTGVGGTLNFKGGDGSQELFTQNDVVGTLVMNTGDGPDSARLDTDRVRGNATINTGEGADSITMNASAISNQLDTVEIGGNLKINTGSSPSDDVFGDSDHVEAVFEVGRALNIKGAAGRQFVRIQPGSEVGRNAVVNLGDGSDELDVQDNVLFRGNLTANFGAGSDLLSIGDGAVRKNLKVNLGSGSSEPDFSDAFFSNGSTVRGSLNVKGSAGIQNISLIGTEVEKNTVVNLGADADLVEVTSAEFLGRFSLNLGQGDDGMESTDSAFGSVSLNGGGGEQDFLLFPDAETLRGVRGFEFINN